jgi:methenyltetrahydromethanopterin cyclohydrolase
MHASHTAAPAGPSINALAIPLVRQLIGNAAALRVTHARLPSGATVVDAGIGTPGGLEAGRLIAEICMGGLGRVTLVPGDAHLAGLPHVQVHAADPVLACLASQYAGWSLSHGEGKGAWFALASGPGRAIVRKEPLFEELRYADSADAAIFVLEGDRPPPEPVVEKVSQDAGLAAEQLTFVLTPTRSLAGTVQVVARVLEVALHKAHALGFPLESIVDGTGSAPVPPPAPEFVTAMGRTNDAILCGGRITLYVHTEDAEADRLARALPASASRDYGKPFAQVFKDYGYDFYKIDPMLFAPAEVMVSNLATGRTFSAGSRDAERLVASFGL